jgi:hypothetical protein
MQLYERFGIAAAVKDFAGVIIAMARLAGHLFRIRRRSPGDKYSPPLAAPSSIPFSLLSLFPGKRKAPVKALA